MRGGEPCHLFVYGTLMRAGRSPYSRLLQARARFVGEGAVRGRLYNLGRFPGAVFDREARTKVFGEAFRLRHQAVLDGLDAYEGCRPGDPKPQLFCRTIVEVRLLDGTAISAWAYALVENILGRPLLASGRFKRD